jgi:hypothetical protein
VADEHVTDRGVLERVDEVDVLLARDAEDVLDALRLQSLHDEPGRVGLRCHAKRLLP